VAPFCEQLKNGHSSIWLGAWFTLALMRGQQGFATFLT